MNLDPATTDMRPAITQRQRLTLVSVLALVGTAGTVSTADMAATAGKDGHPHRESSGRLLKHSPSKMSSACRSPHGPSPCGMILVDPGLRADHAVNSHAEATERPGAALMNIPASHDGASL
jgi:hypothetical protein